MVRKQKVSEKQEIAKTVLELSALPRKVYECKEANAIKKLQDFLVEKGYANTLSDIKKLPRITIKGVDVNGRERLIAKELKNRVGESNIELSSGFNTIYPLLRTGVICYKTANGTHYTHYEITDVLEQTFGLTICEYAFKQGIFYLSSKVKIKEISKKMPFYIATCSIQPVYNIFFEENQKVGNGYFTTQERVLIAQNLMIDEIAVLEEKDVIIGNTIACFKSINYLWEIFRTRELDISDIFKDSINTFTDNLFLKIENIDVSIDFYHRNTDKIINTERDKLLDDIVQNKNVFRILKKNTIGKVINEIAKREDITTFYAAVGFAFHSGLVMVENIFNSVCVNHGKCQLIIGALQKYDTNQFKGEINKETASYLNSLIDADKITLYTNKNAFYHGKFYYLSSQNNAYIIMGSSNLSATAFKRNYEMDMIQSVKKGSDEDLVFLKWYEELRADCVELQYLDENKFEEFGCNSELDVFPSIENSDIEVKEGRVSVKTVLERLGKLSDEETQFRIKLWMKYNPDIYDKDFIEVEALKEYSMFVFNEEKLVVFESFEPRNSYYTFRCPHGLDDLIKEIKNMTKTEMKWSENFVARGNHTKNRENLIVRIDNLFQ